ncbi:hypothetical protein PINS_up007941 [Pythium insidiosum]|nr:hypothetical protein PINS_up007941 [Pythium insidiosum]
MYVSVEHEGCTKAKVLEGLLKHLSLPQQVQRKGRRAVDFVLCVCDDWTDDQMFQTLETLVSEAKERNDRLRLRRQQMRAANASAPAASKRASAPDGAIRSRLLDDSESNGAESSNGNATATGSHNSSTTLARSKSVGSSARGGKQRSSQSQSSSSSGASSGPRSSSTSQQPQRKGSVASSNESSRRRSGSSHGRASTMASGKTMKGSKRLSRLAEDDADLELARAVDEDNKVAFSRLQKVPVRLAEDVAVFTVVVGPDVQHSAGGRHTKAYAVDTLSDVRKVLKEFAEVSREGSQTGKATTGATTVTETEAETEADAVVAAMTTGDASLTTEIARDTDSHKTTVI